MSYLSIEDYESIMNTVKIRSITSEDVGDLSQYSFDSGDAEEYALFLKEKASSLEQLGITKTHVVLHKKTNELIAYFSLSSDTVKLTLDEKDEEKLSMVEFCSLPALKLGKLAVNQALSKETQRKGYGSFVLDVVDTYAYDMLEAGVACRFVVVDADIEYKADTPVFYTKNGFVVNESRKRRSSDKTVSMRRDIFAEA